jgi:general secretion pathway protein C
MELLFKRYFWVLNTLLLVAAGFISARTLASYVKYEVLKPPLVEFAEEEELADDDEVFRRPVAARSVDLRRRKELADASRVVIEEPPEQPEPIEQPEPEQPEPEQEEVSGDIQLVLIATITVSDEAKNMALVSIDGSDNSWVGIGTELKPGFLVSSINNYYITVTQGVTELLWKKQEKPEPSAVLASSGGRSGPPPRKTPEPRKTPKTPKAAPASKYADGIKQTGPFDYRLDRGMLNEQLQDLAKLGREARVIPNYDKESGTYKGFKLIGVRPNSLYRAIGIRSGDVIKQINGEELNSPGKALELFTKLQTSSSIMLDIDRRGKSQTMNYTIE